jgi:hypothetical protein
MALVLLAACRAAGAARTPEPLAGLSLPSTSTPPSTATAIRTSTGAAEAQATAAPGDAQSHAANAVARASAQIDRLRRMQRAPAGENREHLDEVLDDLERERRNVLQDLRAVELEPPGAVIRRQLERDLGALRGALNASYETWPPRGQALPRIPTR